MLKIAFDSRSPKTILCLGAHSDDIEIGCGGTILKILRDFKDTTVYWVVFSSGDLREKEAIQSANVFLKSSKKKVIQINKFRNAYFPYYGAEIKDYFEILKNKVSPDIIFTHYRNDLHQDHRLINELTWNTFRDHLILEYEIPKYDGDMGSPNFYVHLDEQLCRTKIKTIDKYFKSQQDKQWFTEDTFSSIMRFRGVESNAPKKYAEGFYFRKIVF